ncbi:MAG: ribonuclease III [Ruminococcaceae bacterium]|nr:ribonuclease III [Oscillospiraceae bacterium]MBQ6873203.1 ribonuclease III [Clostridia bacterium]
MRKVTELEEKLGYEFKDIRLLNHALTHSSYANERHLASGSNERLEFLGDSVLGVITAEYFYKKFDLPEGELTKLRAATVCEKSLFAFAKELDLGKYLLLGKGEMRMHGAERPSILSDAFESVIAAIYLDGGKEEAERFVLRFISKANIEKPNFRDYKTTLQEIIQKNRDEHIAYVLVGESGPDHDKRFEVEVHLDSNVIGKGAGKSKKLAEQEAAKSALELMGVAVE